MLTPAIMREILYKEVLLSCPLDTPQALPVIPHYLQKACDKQALIGWDQLIQGRLAHAWGKIITTYLHQKKCNAIEMTALTWGRKFVRLMYDLVLKIWHQRNEDGHFSTKRHDSKREQLIVNTEAMQSCNPDIQHQDRLFVFRPMKLLETYSLLNLQVWYRLERSVARVSGRTSSYPSVTLALFIVARKDYVQ